MPGTDSSILSVPPEQDINVTNSVMVPSDEPMLLHKDPPTQVEHTHPPPVVLVELKDL